MKKGNRPYVIVADDDIDVRMSTALCLQMNGIHTIGCADGVEVIKAMTRALKDDHMPAAIITDVNMPHITGRELLELHDAAQEKVRDIPMILMTGEDIDLRDSPCRLLRKPFTLTQLLDEMKRLKLA